MQPWAVDAARRVPMTEREVLQRALAPLIANGTVQWVIDELELEDVRAGLHGHRGLGAHDHPFHDRRRACGLRARRTGRQLDEAKPASADRVQLVVVAEDGDLDA